MNNNKTKKQQTNKNKQETNNRKNSRETKSLVHTGADKTLSYKTEMLNKQKTTLSGDYLSVKVRSLIFPFTINPYQKPLLLNMP